MLRRILSILLICLILWGVKPNAVFSAVDSCTASVSPSSMLPNTPYNLTFTVNNTSSDDIVWVRVSRPSTDFSLDSTDGSGWGYDTLADSFDFHTLAEFHILPSNSKDFIIQSTAGSTESPAQGWVVEVSGSSDGSNPITCTGDTGISISNSAPPSDLSGPTISNLTVTDINSTSAIISFNTDKPASDQLDYGIDTSYGTTLTHSTLSTNHNFSISGLTADTTYYYQVQVLDSNSNLATLSGNSFTTSKTSSTTTTTVVTVTVTPTPTTSVSPSTVPTISPKPVFVPVTDSLPPTGLISTDLNKTYKTAPQIQGIANDNLMVTSVEYSVDGINYLPAEKVDGLGTPTARFSFQPLVNLDGNYPIKVRVKDNSNLEGIINSAPLVIDRLPPRVGANLIAVGPEELLPDQDGVVLGLAGLTEKFTMSAVGGPLTVDLVTGGKVFSLVKNPDNGLWSGGVRFSQPGVYRLNARSVDGAHNQTTRRLNNLVILKNGVVKNSNKPVFNAQISVYTFDLGSGSFVLWDGVPYGQKNPQKTNKSGQYQLFLPPGKYYLTVEVKGFETLKSEIFTTSRNQPINSDFEIKKKNSIGFGPFNLSFLDLTTSEVKIDLSSKSIPKTAKIAPLWVNHLFPTSKLLNNDGRPLSTSLLGKPTIVSFLNTWSPLAVSQIEALNGLTNDKEINSVVVVPEESASSVSIFKKRGEYNISLIADPDGELSSLLDLNSIPTHFFLDRKGKITKIKVGLFSKEDLMGSLLN